MIIYIYSLTNTIGIEFMYVIVIFFSICETFFGPSFTTILPSIIDKENLTNAISIKKTLGRIVSVLTPILGALIVKYFGFKMALLIDISRFSIIPFIKPFYQ